MHNILFYGPFLEYRKGKLNRVGGGESGNKKTVELLKDLNYNVIVLRKPDPLNMFLIRTLIYPLQLLLTYVKFVITLAKTHSTKNVHVSGFYCHLIYIEFLYVLTSKLFKVKSIYEIRGGKAITAYKSRSFLYRFFFRLTLRYTSSILAQGKEYALFFEKLINKELRYYPNFIPSKYFQPYTSNVRGTAKTINLIYFGRVTPSKNIEFIIDIFNKVRMEKEFNFKLFIIGGDNGNNKYQTLLDKKVLEYRLQSDVVFVGALSADKLYEYLKIMHFFIFPTKEELEGHSNSLTEAMSFGIVPLASDYGFNKAIIGNEALIIPEFDANLYTQRIVEILSNGHWEQYSRDMYEIVKKNFTEAAVIQTLREVYSE